MVKEDYVMVKVYLYMHAYNNSKLKYTEMSVFLVRSVTRPDLI